MGCEVGRACTMMAVSALRSSRTGLMPPHVSERS
jgi:hypothetical protein